LTGHSRRRKLKPGRLLIFLGLLIIMLLSGAVLGLVAISIKDIPAWNSDALTSSNATTIYDRNNNLVAKIGTENRVPLSINEIPDIVQDAFLSAEDHRFYQHHGFDFWGIMRAAFKDITGGGIREGASTITQQLVKLTFLTQEQTFKRKIQELILSLQVEHYYSKPEILEMYLNKIYFGQGAYGIQSASQTYFKKDAKDLTLAEAAYLAGIIKSPNYYDPFAEKDTPSDQPHQGKLRQKTVLQLMAEYGVISQEEADNAYEEEFSFSKNPTKYPYPYFVDYVTEKLIETYGEDIVYNSGMKVYTTLDPKIQTAAEEVLADNNNFPPPINDKERPQAAVVVLDPTNGHIRAIVGGREHTSRLGWNRATREPGRQPGSTFKPIIDYGPAIEFLGMGPATVIDDAPVKYGNYVPPNFDNKYKGLITLRTALINSINIVAVKLLVEHVTIPKAIEFASRLGIDIDIKSVGASLALGTEEVTPLQMASAYSAFANNGVYNEPVAILKIHSLDGTVLEEYKPRPKQAMKQTTAYLMTNMMESVTSEGTGQYAHLDRPTAGKTGTTDDGKDIWFVGYTPDLVAAVYMGYDNPTPMKEAFGGGFPAKIFNKIMTQAHSGLPVKHFKRPPGLVSATVDSKSGLLPGPNTPPNHMVTDLFVEGTVPTEIDNTHVMVEVCADSGLLANKSCPNKVLRNLIQLPYTVPENVADFNERVPTKTCDIHSDNIILPPVQNDPTNIKPANDDTTGQKPVAGHTDGEPDINLPAPAPKVIKPNGNKPEGNGGRNQKLEIGN